MVVVVAAVLVAIPSVSLEFGSGEAPSILLLSIVNVVISVFAAVVLVTAVAVHCCCCNNRIGCRMVAMVFKQALVIVKKA